MERLTAASALDFFAGFFKRLKVEYVPEKEAETLYKQIVQAIRSCYGGDYSLDERLTSEFDLEGRKHNHHEAVFTCIYCDEKNKLPSIRVTSFAIESGQYSVTVELVSLVK